MPMERAASNAARGANESAASPQGADDRRNRLKIVAVEESARRRLALQMTRLQRERERLEQERAELAAEREALEAFPSIAAHELLKALIVTDACAAAIERRLEPRMDWETRQDLETMQRVSARVRREVEALLADARRSTAPLKTRPVDLTLTLQESIETLSPEIKAHSARIEVDPMPIVRGDPALLQGVFTNLLSNALKYGPREDARVRVGVERANIGWTVSVENLGPPIQNADLERIFEPFQRGRNERRARGAGLGLAIVRRIVERHGGEVTVGQFNGSRNRFDVTLPA